jgi:transposase
MAKIKKRKMEMWKRGRLGERQMEIHKFNKKVKQLTYPQDWTAYNLAKTQEKIISEKLLTELLEAVAEKRIFKKGGRSAPLKDKVFCMFVYNYSGFSSRRCISDVKIAHERKLIEKVPHFNSILNYFADPNTTPLIKKLITLTALPLRNVEKDFAVDSSGFSTSLFDRWVNYRTQKVSKKRHWKKCHITVGVRSNIITAVKITQGNTSDCPEFINLVRETRGFFNVEEVSADKAYLSRANLDAVSEMGAIPYIPFKSNSVKKSKGSPTWSRMYDYFLNNRERFDQSYHKRSNVETAFHMIKRKFGNNLRTKRDISHINEILMKCLCHNLSVLVQESFELGLDIDFSHCAEIYAAQK